MDPQTSQAQSETFPKDWPGASKIFKYAKAATLTNWVLYLGLTLGTGLITSLLSEVMGGDNSSQSVTAPYIVAQVVVFAINLVLSACLVIIQLHNVRHEKIGFGEAISATLGRLPAFIGMALVMYVLLVLSLVALIVPFFFVMPRLSLAQYFFFDQNMGPLEAIKASWNASSGHVGKVWGIIGMCIVYSLLIFTIIGIPVALYLLFMYSSAPALLYMWLKRSPSAAETPTSPISPVTPVTPV